MTATRNTADLAARLVTTRRHDAKRAATETLLCASLKRTELLTRAWLREDPTRATVLRHIAAVLHDADIHTFDDTHQCLHLPESLEDLWHALAIRPNTRRNYRKLARAFCRDILEMPADFFPAHQAPVPVKPAPKPVPVPERASKYVPTAADIAQIFCTLYLSHLRDRHRKPLSEALRKTQAQTGMARRTDTAALLQYEKIINRHAPDSPWIINLSHPLLLRPVTRAATAPKCTPP